MPLPPVDTFLDTLRRLHFIPGGRFEELAQLGTKFTSTQALADDLVQRGWLTPYQLDHLARDHADDLVLGSYLLREPLGAGSRGQVFKARHQKMGRIVALRIIRQDLLADGDAVQRFYQQIEQASQLAHASVVMAFDAGPIGATHFLAMEYVEGIDLGRKVAAEGPIPWQQACTYIVQAALGLQHAFERGLLHGGITPANLFVTGRKDESKPTRRWLRRRTVIGTAWGTVKIMDFGQAGLSQGAEAASAKPTVQDYAAPEPSADVRSDLFALGCTFYFLLTGRPPYPGGARLRAGATQWQELEVMQQLPVEVPAAVAEVLRRMIALAPEDRYATPAETATELAVAADEPGLLATATNHVVIGPSAAAVPSAVQQRRAAEKRRQFLIIGGGSIALLAGLVFLYTLLFSNPLSLPSPSGPDTPAAAELRRLSEIMRHQPDADELWTGFLALAQKYPGTPEALEARQRSLYVPSPLDRWSLQRIPEAERFAAPAYQQPKELVAVFGEHRWCQWGSAPRCLAYSSDGTLVASGGEGGLVYLWEAPSGRLRALLRAHIGQHVRALAFVPRSSLVVSGGNDSQVVLWDASKGESKRLLGHGGAVQAVAVAPDGQTIASAGDDRTLRLWDVARREGKDAVIDAAHDKPIVALSFAPDGQTVASGGVDGTIKLWDVAARKARATWLAHPGGVHALALAAKGDTLATSGVDKKVKLWNTAAQELKVLNLPLYNVQALAFSPDGNLLAFAGEDRLVRLWDPATGAERTILPITPAPSSSLAFAPDGKTLAYGCTVGDFGIRLWDVEKGGPVLVLPNHIGPVQALAFTPEARTLASSAQDRALRFWDIPTGRERATVAGPRPDVETLASSPDGNLLFSGAPAQPQIERWDCATGKSKTALKVESPGPTLLTFTPDGQALALVDNNGMVRLLDPASGKEKGALGKGHPRAGLAFSADGRLLVTSSATDKEGMVWDVAARKEKVALKGHEQALTAVAFAPDGQTVATGGADRTVRFWDPFSGKERPTLMIRHNVNPMFIAYTPDGHGLSADPDGQLLYWRASSGGRGQVRTIQLPGSIHSLALAPDGRHVAVGNDNGTIYVLRLAPLPIRAN